MAFLIKNVQVFRGGMHMDSINSTYLSMWNELCGTQSEQPGETIRMDKSFLDGHLDSITKRHIRPQVDDMINEYLEEWMHRDNGMDKYNADILCVWDELNRQGKKKIRNRAEKKKDNKIIKRTNKNGLLFQKNVTKKYNKKYNNNSNKKFARKNMRVAYQRKR
jgi:hypothetical protein